MQWPEDQETDVYVHGPELVEGQPGRARRVAKSLLKEVAKTCYAKDSDCTRSFLFGGGIV